MRAPPPGVAWAPGRARGQPRLLRWRRGRRSPGGPGSGARAAVSVRAGGRRSPDGAAPLSPSPPALPPSNSERTPPGRGGRRRRAPLGFTRPLGLQPSAPLLLLPPPPLLPLVPLPPPLLMIIILPFNSFFSALAKCFGSKFPVCIY